MRTASISEAKNGLSALLDRVRHGETILILDRQTPVAQLCPANTPAASLGEANLHALARLGLVRLPVHQPDAKVLEMPLPKTSDGHSVLDALLEERRDGR